MRKRQMIPPSPVPRPAIARRSARLAACLLLAAGCSMGDMYDQPRYEPLEPSAFFANGMSSRHPVPGTVPSSADAAPDPLRDTGRDGDRWSEVFPFPISMRDLARGREQYRVFCTPCHGLQGDGEGMIVQRGLSRPPSFHSKQLREAPVGHYFDVITHGYGAMYPYDYRVEVDDRWRIIAYIRALQLSRRAEVAQLPQDLQRQLRGSGQ
jgi:Cytochrome C oxidase, cbb3-type, subunit III